MCNNNNDKNILEALKNAPIDDELETAEEREAIERAREDVRQGRVYSTDEVMRELEL